MALTLRFYLTPVEMVTSVNMSSSEYWRECREEETFGCWWKKCKLVCTETPYNPYLNGRNKDLWRTKEYVQNMKTKIMNTWSIPNFPSKEPSFISQKTEHDVFTILKEHKNQILPTENTPWNFLFRDKAWIKVLLKQTRKKVAPSDLFYKNVHIQQT